MQVSSFSKFDGCKGCAMQSRPIFFSNFFFFGTRALTLFVASKQEIEKRKKEERKEKKGPLNYIVCFISINKFIYVNSKF